MGSAFNYVVDTLDDLGVSARVFKIGFSYPLPLDRIREFAAGVDELLVVEELEPLMENDIKADFLSHGTRTPVSGKEELLVPCVHELNVDVMAKILEANLRALQEGFELGEVAGRIDDSGLPLGGLGLEDRNAGVWLDKAVIAAEGKVQQYGHEDTVEPSVGDDEY